MTGLASAAHKSIIMLLKTYNGLKADENYRITYI